MLEQGNLALEIIDRMSLAGAKSWQDGGVRLKLLYGVFDSEQGANSHRARSSDENTKARDEGALENTELQSCDEHRRVDLNLAPCDRQQFLEMKQRAKDKYDFVDSNLMSPDGMTRNGYHTRLNSTIGELTSKVRNEGRGVEGRGMRSVKVRPPKEAIMLGGDRKVGTGSMGSVSSSFSASERTAVGGKPEMTRKGKKEGESRNREVQRARSRKAGCREPDVALHFATKMEALEILIVRVEEVFARLSAGRLFQLQL